MKVTLAVLALTSVNGHHCPFMKALWEQHNWKAGMVDILYKPMFGGHVTDNCEETQKYEHGTFHRKMMQAGYRSGVQGWYQEEDLMVSEECFGDWIDEMWGPIHNLGQKIHQDWWSPSYDDWEQAGKALLDIHFKNGEACQFEKVGQDKRHWCLENEAECFRWGGFFGRVAENFMPLASNHIAMFGMVKNNDMCYSDDQLIEQHGNFWEKMMNNSAITKGFDHQWNPTENLDVILKSDFKKEKRAYKSTHHPFMEKVVPEIWDEMRKIFG